MHGSPERSLVCQGWEATVMVHEPLLTATDQAVLQSWMPEATLAAANVVCRR